jgi:transcriptional regulator GlxA family with amidase domain
LQTAKFWLLPDSGELQAPYAAMPLGIQHKDAVIRRCQLWIGEHYDTQNPVNAMLELSQLAATTFARRFRRATGYAPMEYVHAVRVESAKRMLEIGNHSIEFVGESSGYDDISSFRRLFKRKTGLTPSDYRKLFGSARFDRYATKGMPLVS